MPLYKVVIAGSAGSGKSSIINQYVYGTFDSNAQATIGVEFSHKDIDGETKLTLWDTAGQERFSSMTGSYYRNAHAVMLVYDISSRESFYNLEQWWREYNAYGNVQKSVAIVIGNKTDLERNVSEEEARAWAVQKSLLYDEVSAKNNDGIQRAMNSLIRQMRDLPEVKAETVRLREQPKSDRCCY